jgi:cytochrome b
MPVPIKEISMNATSASRADPSVNRVASESVATSAPRRPLVWDAPVRAFHWLMVASFAGAWITAESERWRLAHVTLGYTVAALVVFRVLWGLVGTRHARFSSFVRGPRAVARYLGSLLRGRPERHAGHNPAGALAIVALLALALAVVASGWATYNDLFGGWLDEAHEALATGMLAVAGVHVAGVLLGSWLHRENLIGAMITGRKPVRPDEGIRHAWHAVAVLMLVAAPGFWWLQWHGAPVADGFTDRPIAAAKASQGAHDGD